MAMRTNILLCFLVAGLSAQEPLSENLLRETIQHHKSLAQHRDLLKNLGQAQAKWASAYENPALLLERESTAETESLLGVSWTLDKLGQRSRLERWAATQASGEEAQFEADVAALIYEARLSFHHLANLQRQERELSQLENAFQQQWEQVAVMVKSGAVPALDEARLQLLLKQLKLELRQIKVAQTKEWSRLSIWFPEKANMIPPLQAELFPPKSASTTGKNMQMLALKLAMEAAKQEVAIHTKKWTEVEISLGLKQTELNGEQDSGYALGLRIPIGMRPTQREQQLRARQTAGETQLRLDFLQRQKENQRPALLAEIAAQRESGDRFIQLLQEADRLVDQSLLAYRQGEADLQVYLDALTQRKTAKFSLLGCAANAWQAHLQAEFLGGGHD